MDPRRLREETRVEHEATEALMPLGGDELSLALYVRTLRVLLPLISSWERWAEAAAPEDLREVVRVRRRSPLLRVDLEVLTRNGAGDGAGAEGMPVPWDTVTGITAEEGREASRALFLGALYVMEGSTLGGRFLARHVEKVLGLEPGRGDAYFQGHGERTAGLWKEITAEIGDVPEEWSPLVVASARRTFGAFGEVLRAGLSQG